MISISITERKSKLNAPIDLLKVGHHDSINSTPRRKDRDGEYEVNQIFDAILPVPNSGEQPFAQAIVSTQRTFYKPIPESDMLVELARRVANTRNYASELGANGVDPEDLNKHFEKYEAEFIDKPQPLWTDLEKFLNDADFVDVEIDPKTGSRSSKKKSRVRKKK